MSKRKAAQQRFCEWALNLFSYYRKKPRISQSEAFQLYLQLVKFVFVNIGEQMIQLP